MKILPVLLVITFFFSCSSIKLKEHVFPEPVDTSPVPVEMQVKRSITHGGVTADNLFDGARMNDFVQINDTTYRVIVSPENEPINSSAYFGFRLKSNLKQNIDLEISYTGYDHRYIPKLSYDAINWTAMDSMSFDTLKGPQLATLKLSIDERPLYVCGQELMTSSHAISWTDMLASYTGVSKEVAGKSRLGRDILFVDIDENPDVKKEAIVVFSRLHPPEVSGYKAMIAFVETIMDDSALSKLFRKKFRVLIYPMINPDGVDLGHWRHSAGGVDLNRDWAYYRQTESKVVAEHLIEKLKERKSSVVLGLDFHSTQEDIFYTLTDNRQSSIFGFKDIWLESIDNTFPDYTPIDGAYDLNTPITKGWFYLQFGAEGITYEVGDETPRKFVKAKGQTSAREMMKLMVLRKLD